MLVIVCAGLVITAVATAAASMQTSKTAVHEAQQRGAGTCDFRLAESTRYSQWTAALSALGVSANTTVNVNGEFLGSGECHVLPCIVQATLRTATPHAEFVAAGSNVSLEDFLAQDAASVRSMVLQNVLPVVHGGAGTTALLVIDIEEPARPDSFYALNDSTLVRVVDALRLRVAALKHAMPRCSVSFYGTSLLHPIPPGFAEQRTQDGR